MTRNSEEPHLPVSGADGDEAQPLRRRMLVAVVVVLLLFGIAAVVLRLVVGAVSPASPPDTGSETAEVVGAPVPTSGPIPKVVGLTRARALAALEASGYAVWVFSAAEHANDAIVPSATVRPDVRVTAAIALPDGFTPASAQPVVLVALGRPRPSAAMPGGVTPWWFEHAPTVQRDGTARCFFCHRERECSDCHVKLSRPAGPKAATDASGVHDAVSRIAGERTAAGAMLIRDAVTSGDGTYTVDLNADANARDGPVVQADGITLQLLEGLHMRELGIGTLLLRWFLPLDSQPFLVVRVGSLRAGRTNWKSVEASAVPTAVDAYTLDTSRLL